MAHFETKLPQIWVNTSQNYTGKASTRTCHPTLSFSCCGGVRQPGLLPPGISQHSTHPHWYRTPGSKWWELHLQGRLQQMWKVTELFSKRRKNQHKTPNKIPKNPHFVSLLQQYKEMGWWQGEAAASAIPNVQKGILENNHPGTDSGRQRELWALFPIAVQQHFGKKHSHFGYYGTTVSQWHIHLEGKETTSFYSFNSDKLKQQTDRS